MWSRLKHWFVAPFTPRVSERVPGPMKRVSVSRAPIEVPAARQAIAFLEWLQRDDGRTGDVFPAELMEMYWEMCAWENWKVLTWQRVGHELSVLIGGGSKLKWVDGKKQRVWHIPKRVPPRVVSVDRIVPPARQRVLGPMATRVEAA